MPKLSLKAARVNAGFTQKEAARRLNVGHRTLWSWENGKSFPKSSQIDDICELYGVPYDNIKFFNVQNA